MPRRRVAQKREILPDPVFSSQLVAKFITTVMKCGKKSVAERIVYGALDNLLVRKKPSFKDAEADEGEGGSSSTVMSPRKRDLTLELFEEVLNQVRPTLEVRSRRVGGATYQIPVEVPARRRTTLAMRWIIDAALKRGEKGMVQRLSAEMMDALEGRGNAVKKREDTLKMAKANQAFAHYRWN